MPKPSHGLLAQLLAVYQLFGESPGNLALTFSFVLYLAIVYATVKYKDVDLIKFTCFVSLCIMLIASTMWIVYIFFRHLDKM